MVPSCRFSSERVSVALENLDISARQERLLADIAETMIPATDTPGAESLDVHHFVLVMIDDCRDRSDQEVFMEGMERIDPLSNQYFGTSFSGSTPAQREQLLLGVLEEKEEFKKGIGDGFDRFREFLLLVKRYTVQGFLESQYVMTEIFPYVMAPGYFDGCAPVESKS